MRETESQEVRINPPERKPQYAAFFLVGATAIGKSAVAQIIAEREGWDILSADSMLVYRGMDIGTDKPGSEARSRVRYWGIDLADPDESFSVGDYVAHAREVFQRAGRDGRPVLVVGGTGLYVKCLIEGLDRLPPGDDRVRKWAEELLEREGVEALQRELQGRDPGRYEALADPKNPRRLVRALELAMLGAGTRQSRPKSPSVPMAGLSRGPGDLRERIHARVRRMYGAGFLKEVEKLSARYPRLSRTALQAIGYSEGLAILRNEMTVEEAIEHTAIRTRQLAKRQATWFRHQASAEWIDVKPNDEPVAVAEKVSNVWKKHGPTPVNINA
jgi:tRNA dimethylallyltransferase